MRTNNKLNLHSTARRSCVKLGHCFFPFLKLTYDLVKFISNLRVKEGGKKKTTTTTKTINNKKTKQKQGCRDGAVVRALVSHQCGSDSIPELGVVCDVNRWNEAGFDKLLAKRCGYNT